jgi:ABC-type lipoprotein export system ATPase subunit
MPIPLASIKHSKESIWGNHLELNQGSRIMLNASSGKGKTTFTTTAFGLRRDYNGILSYDDVDIKELGPDDWATIRKTKISVVFQDLQLFQKLTVRDNLMLKNSLTDTFSEAQIKQLLEQLEIENKWKQQCGLLSMGQQQRVAIIRAMTQPFKWLIMDEPFSHLDNENANKCMTMIEERALEQNAGYILTSLGERHGINYDQELRL